MLSAGQKRRTNLARLIAAPAPLWLLDEPSVALDRASVKTLEGLIAEHRANGGMVAVSTHTDLDLPGARELLLDRFSAPPEDDQE
jgi:heme exporter protein A